MLSAYTETAEKDPSSEAQEKEKTVLLLERSPEARTLLAQQRLARRELAIGCMPSIFQRKNNIEPMSTHALSMILNLGDEPGLVRSPKNQCVGVPGTVQRKLCVL